jgi:asparagine synthase (glutamine-hydrolysing)
MMTIFCSNVLMGRGSEISPQTRWGKLDDVLSTSGGTIEAYQTAYALFSRRTIKDLMIEKRSILHWGLYPDRLDSIRSQVEGLREHDAISQLELLSFVGERLLRDTDAASMAVSLEVRVPLLDHEFVEVLSKVPVAERYPPLGQKNLLKSFVTDQIDPKIFDRPKAGFELPLELWCKRSLMERMRDMLQDVNLIHRVGLDAETVGRLWRAFQKDGAGVYWSRIWSIYVLLDWCKRHRLSI